MASLIVLFTAIFSTISIIRDRGDLLGLLPRQLQTLELALERPPFLFLDEGQLGRQGLESQLILLQLGLGLFSFRDVTHEHQVRGPGPVLDHSGVDLDGNAIEVKGRV